MLNADGPRIAGTISQNSGCRSICPRVQCRSCIPVELVSCAICLGCRSVFRNVRRNGIPPSDINAAATHNSRQSTGKRNESSYVLHVAEKLSDIYELPLKEIETVTTKNAMELFNLPGK